MKYVLQITIMQFFFKAVKTVHTGANMFGSLVDTVWLYPGAGVWRYDSGGQLLFFYFFSFSSFSFFFPSCNLISMINNLKFPSLSVTLSTPINIVHPYSQNYISLIINQVASLLGTLSWTSCLIFGFRDVVIKLNDHFLRVQFVVRITMYWLIFFVI